MPKGKEQTENAEPVEISTVTRQRGPVEEVIARRMKQLGKKLVSSHTSQACCWKARGLTKQQRYRTYASAERSTLNADQIAALDLLPGLEGAYKELEELTREKGPVDVSLYSHNACSPGG